VIRSLAADQKSKFCHQASFLSHTITLSGDQGHPEEELTVGEKAKEECWGWNQVRAPLSQNAV